MTTGLAAASFVVMAAAQIAIPLVDDDRALTVAVIVAFACTTVALAARTWGPGRAGLALAVTAVGTLALERVGSTTGIPFGEYEYSDLLRPQVAGIPVVVPLAWFAMGVPALVVGRRLLAGRVGAVGRVGSVVVGAIALTAWDLFLDPQMVDEGYWVWAVDGFYRGIPLSNYAGWLVSSVAVLAVLDRILPTVSASGRTSGTPVPGSGRTSGTLLAGLYAWWAVMNTIGFVVFFGDALVGLVGGVVMVPLAVLGVRNPAVARG